jgi:hypothetical protein
MNIFEQIYDKTILLEDFKSIKNLYIATDNKDTYNIFKNRYTNKIKINYTNEVYNSLRHTSIKDAIIDLYMCVYSNNFKGSGWSSFTETIEQLRSLK